MQTLPTPPHELTVWVNGGALADMEAEARRAHPLETGGMLVGWENDERNVVAVTGVIGPGPASAHHRTRFEPDTAWQQERLGRVYEATRRRITYLGDWHVHPDGGFGMSRRDRRTLRMIGSEADARCPRPLMGLLAGDGQGGYSFGVWAWQCNRRPWSPGDAIPVTVRRWSPNSDEVFWPNDR